MISVVIPTHQRPDKVVRAVQSIQTQTHTNLEILVVVDGSHGRTCQLLEHMQRTEPRLRVFEQANAGVSAARNHGMRVAEGTYIALLDDDDLAMPQRLEAQLHTLKGSAALVPTLCVSDMEWVYSDGRREPQLYSEPITPAMVYSNEIFFPPTSWMASKETFARVGLFDEAMRAAEDSDWLCRLSKLGGHIVSVPEPLVTYAVPARDTIYPGHAAGIERLLLKHGDVIPSHARGHLENEIKRALGQPLILADSKERPQRPTMTAPSGKLDTQTIK